MIVDANILLYATDESSPFHANSVHWLEGALNGPRRIGLPWSSLMAFVRIATHPRVASDPLSAADAWGYVEAWLDAPAAWIPAPGRGHREILGRLVRDLDVRGNLVSDAALAALCIEYGTGIASADSDFARFTEIEWINPAAIRPPR